MFENEQNNEQNFEKKYISNVTKKEEKKQTPKGLIVKYYKEKEELLAEKKKRKEAKSKIPTLDMLSADQTDLYDYLRGFRREIAFKENVAPFIVFNNTSLIDMCLKLPQTLAEFRNIYGVGEYKQKKYGEMFIQKIEEYYGIDS